ncbi:MAG: ferritin [Chloroflexota bacterium]
MNISETLQNAINAQINAELYSAYLYLAMSAHFETQALPGFAKWTRMQAQEETEHAMKFFDFVNDRGGKVALKTIEGPKTEFGSALEIFEEILAHENKVTSLIYGVYEVAVAEKDYAAQVMLHWFIDEQVEEEKNAGLIVDQLRLVGDRPGNLLHMDRHIGKRED